MSAKLPKTDKRQLFLDRNRKHYLEFDLEKTKTCSEVFNSLKEEINKKILEIYDNTKKLEFSFIMIYSKFTSKWDNSLIEIKLDIETSLSDIMTNRQYYLCYLPVNTFNMNTKRKARNKLEEVDNDRFKGVERITKESHELEKYLSNEGIYYFDKENNTVLLNKK